MDSRRIHEPLDEIESRDTSEMGGWAQSPWRIKEWRRLEALGGVICIMVERGGREVLVALGPDGWSETSRLGRSIAVRGAVGDVATCRESRGFS